VEGQNLVVSYQNIREVTVKLFVVDLEVLFSANPFLSTASENDNF